MNGRRVRSSLWRGPLLAAACGVLLLPLPARAAAPVVDSIDAAPAVVAPDDLVTVTVAAHDPDCPSTCTSGCGLYIRADLTAWSADGGVIESTDDGVSASPYTASAVWRAPSAEGSYTISVDLSDSGGLFCGGRATTTGSVTVQVTTSTNGSPSVTGVDASPGRVYTGQSAGLLCAGSDPDGDELTFEWSTDLGTLTPVTSGGGVAEAVLETDRPGIASVACTVRDPSGASATGSVQVAVTDAIAERILSAGLSVPHRLSVDDLGNVYVVDRSRSGIQVVHLASGEPVYRLEVPGVTCVAVDWAGDLLIGLTGGARVIDRSGRNLLDLELEPGAGAVADVAVDPVARRYVTLHRGSGRVIVHDAGGARIAAFGSTGGGADEFLSPGGVAVAPDGRILVADAGQGLIKVFEPLSGALVRSFGGLGSGAGRFVRLDDVDVGPDGIVWASDSFQDWVQAFDPDGTLREVLGTYGGGLGELKTAAGVAVAGAQDRLLAASVNSGAVQVFRTSTVSAPVAAPDLSYTPATVDFGPRPVGVTSGPRQVTLTNSGTAPLGVRRVATDGDFAVSHDCTAFLDPGGSCTASVIFTPATVGSRAGRLLLDTSDAAAGAGGAVSVPLSGSGFVPGRVVAAPGTLDFPDQPVGTVSDPFAVTLSNPGTTSVTIAAIGASGPFGQSHTCPAVLPAGASCSVSVVFAPSGIGDHLVGELSVRTGGGTERLPLEGRGVALEITPWPGTLDFGPHRLDDPPETRVVTVGNTGSDFVEILGTTVGGAAPASFTIESDGCTGRTLWLNDECTLEVAFAPESEGTLAGTLEIANTGPAARVTLDGVGIDRSVLDIPTLGEWGLLGLALLLGLTGIAVLGGSFGGRG